MPLRLEVKYIYFIIGLSWQGEVAKLQACGVRQGLPIEDYIYFYFLPYTEKIKIQVLVNSNQILSLKVIALVLVRIEWVASLHQAYRNLMFYSIECMKPTIYDWSTSLLNTMKQHLIECRIGRIKNFRFTNILSTFFFEWVLGFSPRVKVPPYSL